MRSRWLPRPLSSALLFATWLLLQNSVAPLNVLGALLLALLLPRLLDPLLGPPPALRRPGRLLRYLGIVIVDIIGANIEVAGRVLRPNRLLRPAHLDMPLALRDEFAIAVLASTITLTPGTVSTRISDDRRTLSIHALHVEDRDALIARIKQRYEQPLQEIFEC